MQELKFKIKSYEFIFKVRIRPLRRTSCKFAMMQIRKIGKKYFFIRK